MAHTFCVMSFGPVVAGAWLSEHEVVRSEELTEGPAADRVHGAGLEVDQDCPRHVFAISGLVVVDVDALQLEVTVAVVRAGGVDAMLVTYHFPELGADLITALSGLDVHYFAHSYWSVVLIINNDQYC